MCREMQNASCERRCSCAGRATGRAQDGSRVPPPVRARPDLVPVGNQPISASASRHGGREERKVRKRRGMDDIELPTAAKQIATDGDAEADWRPEGAAFVVVDGARRNETDHVDARQLRRLGVPVAHREMRDLVPGLAEREREVVHPAFATAHGRGVEVVVDQTMRTSRQCATVERVVSIRDPASSRPMRARCRRSASSAG